MFYVGHACWLFRLGMFLYACIMYEDLYYGILLLTIQDMSEIGHIVSTKNSRTVQQKDRLRKMLKTLTIQKEVSNKLMKGLLDLVVLQFLGNQPMHGYQVITKIRKNYGVYFGPSTVYPLLNSLEKKGLVKGDWNMSFDRPRKIYSLTSSGQSMLDFTQESLNLICRKLTNQTGIDQSVSPALAMLAKLPARKEVA